MKNLTKRLAGKFAVMALAVTALTGVGVAADTVGAEAAQAATATHCILVDAGYGYKIYGPSSSGRYATSCYFNYDWFEEAVLRYRDGYKLVNVREVRCDWQYRVGC